MYMICVLPSMKTAGFTECSALRVKIRTTVTFPQQLQRRESSVPKDLKTWERLDNLKTLQSPQQRNVCLHPEFVDGKYAFYTRPMDGFIETGSGGGIGFGLCEDICHAVIDEEKIISRRYLPYHYRSQKRCRSSSFYQVLVLPWK